MPVCAKDLLMRIKRSHGGPSVQVQLELFQEEEIEEEEHILIAQFRARRKRAESTELIVSIAVIDSTRRLVEIPTSKPQKKRKRSKPLVKETPKKTKLLPSAIFAMKSTKVHLVLCLPNLGLYA